MVDVLNIGSNTSDKIKEVLSRCNASDEVLEDVAGAFIDAVSMTKIDNIPMIDMKNPTIYSGPKEQGRNTPCSCGSELKYKKCCGRK